MVLTSCHIRLEVIIKMEKVNANNGTLLLRKAGLLQPVLAENLQELYLKLSQQDLKQPWKEVRPTLKARD